MDGSTCHSVEYGVWFSSNILTRWVSARIAPREKGNPLLSFFVGYRVFCIKDRKASLIEKAALAIAQRAGIY